MDNIGFGVKEVIVDSYSYKVYLNALLIVCLW